MSWLPYPSVHYPALETPSGTLKLFPIFFTGGTTGNTPLGARPTSLAPAARWYPACEPKAQKVQNAEVKDILRECTEYTLGGDTSGIRGKGADEVSPSHDLEEGDLKQTKPEKGVIYLKLFTTNMEIKDCREKMGWMGRKI
jgi:hypothetical protein